MNLTFGQRYKYRVLQTIQMKLILLCVLAEPADLGSSKTALKFKYLNRLTHIQFNVWGQYLEYLGYITFHAESVQPHHLHRDGLECGCIIAISRANCHFLDHKHGII